MHPESEYQRQQQLRQMKQIIQRLEERLEENDRRHKERDRRHEANHQEIVLLRSEMQRKDLHSREI